MSTTVGVLRIMQVHARPRRNMSHVGWPNLNIGLEHQNDDIH
jgi:hypothetical protein